MILRISILLALLLIAPALYIYMSQMRRGGHKTPSLIFLAPNALLLAATVYLACNDHRINDNAEFVAVFLVAVLCVAVPEAVYALFSALGTLSRRKAMRKIGKCAGAVLAAMALATVVYAVATCYLPPVVKRTAYHSPEVPQAFDGYRIVHISDLHLGIFKFYPKAVKAIVSAINRENADMVAFTGDLVNFDSKEIAPFRHDMASIKAKDGVVAVMGNHDYFGYADFGDKDGCRHHIAALQNEKKAAGWRLLLNENLIVRRGGDSIAVVGSENGGGKTLPALGDLRKATRGLGNCFKLLLTHDPSQWKREVLPQTDIHLTLSGHTHAGQVKLMGRSPAEIAFKEWEGFYYHGERAMNVSSGLGEALVPLRIGVRPAIDVITLKRIK